MSLFPKPKEFGPVNVQGRQLKCIICSNGDFWEHEIPLPTPLFDLLDPQAWNRVAQCAVCARCGYVHMFIPPSAFQEDKETSPGVAAEGNA